MRKKAKIKQEELERNGYIKNDWGTIVYPEKDFAAFNNYIQSMATEIMVDKTEEIKNFLSPYRSELLFQVHDSLVFDIHPQEKDIVEKIIQIIMYSNGMKFSVNYSYGFDYKNLSKEISIVL